MFDKKSKDQNDLDLGEINLLPEDLRSSADKYLRSKKSDEALYQLRAPKKLKKRRRAFAWLPFFGGAHWEVTPESRPKVEAPVPKLSDAVAVETNAPQSPDEQERAKTSNEFGIITPVFGQKVSGTVSPKAKRSFKGGFSFASFFGKKKPVIPDRGSSSSTSTSSPVPDSEHAFVSPPRHYSLLSDNQSAGEAHHLKPLPPIARPMESTESVTHGTRPITPEAAPAKAATPVSKHGSSWHLPKWLDIFSLLSFMTRSGKAPHVQQVKKAATPSVAEKVTAPSIHFERQQSIQPITAVSSASDHRVEQGIPSVPLTPIPSLKSESHLKPFTPPMQKTPVASPTVQPQKIHRPWHLPKWMDIFYLLSLLRLPKRRVSQLPKKNVPPTPPAPVIARAPVTPNGMPSKVLPVTSAVVPPSAEVSIKPSATTAPLTPPSPPVGSVPAVTPTPQPKHSSNDIVPIVDAGDHVKAKKQKVHRGTLFHMPSKSAFTTASKELREINLIPGAFFAPKSWKQIGVSIAIVVFIAVGVLGLAYGGLQAWRTKLQERTAEIDSEIDAFKNKILIYNQQEPEMSALGARIELVSQLLGRHIYWTNFFKLLEKYTLADIYYDGVDVSPTGTFSLTAHGPSFKTVSQVLLFLNSAEAKEFVSSAVITGANLGENADGREEVTFTIELTMNPKLLYYNAGNNK